MSSQIGKLESGTSGYPINFLLTGLTSSDLAAIQSVNMIVTRPDTTTFSSSLGPSSIVNGAIQYIVAVGDLPAGIGTQYTFQFTINSTGSRVLVLRGMFQIEDK